ncbi:MAG: hypothetical protein U0174_09410 [Polyangiaceae bacterium]
MNRTTFSRLALFAATGGASLLFACGGGRPPEVYQSDITKLIATTNDKVQACYRDALKENPSIAGDLTVLFWAGGRETKLRTVVDRDIEMKFGNLGIVKSKTTVPLSLGKCVTAIIDKLELTPADPKRAEVAWTWHFSPNQAPMSGPAVAPSAALPSTSASAPASKP